MTIVFPALPPAALPSQLLRLAANDPEASNERDEEVRITHEEVVSDDKTVHVHLPPWGFVALVTPGETR